MKNWTVAKWSLGLALAALPLGGGCVQKSENPAPTVISTTNQTAADTAAVANAPAPEEAEQELENAPGKIVSVAQPPAQAANLAPSAAEVARLAQSGLEENVMLAFVTNSTSTFNLGSDQIIYLNDIGVPASVVTAMIQHDQASKAPISSPTPAPPVYVNSPAPAVAPETLEPQPTTTVVESAPPENVSNTYFYDSLAPYGNWIEIGGYGRCWQPTACVANRGWRPYCNGGRWVYSNCGWYWASDYSWGWAPFHYGRWFNHSVWGWCWAPDTVWGPAWVSWRSSPGYCGWAPLPPTACYQSGVGFTYYGNSVSAGFSFGLGASCFTFISDFNFCNSHPNRYCVPPQNAAHIYHNSTVINPVVEKHGNERFHKGIPVERIAESTHQEIKPVRIHETTDTPGNGRGEHHDRNNGTLTVFRPHLPEPPNGHAGNRVGEGVKPANPDNGGVRRVSTDTAMHKGIPRQSSDTASSALTVRRNDNVPVFRAPTISPKQGETRPGNTTETALNVTSLGNGQPRNTHAVETTPRTSNGNEFPPGSLVIRGRPNNTGDTGRPNSAPQAKLDSAMAPATPPTVERNTLLNRRQAQITTPQPQVETAASQKNPYVRRDQPIPRQEAPRPQPRDQRIFVPPAVPVQRQPETRIYQAPQAQVAAPRPSFNPAPAPSVSTIPAQTTAPRVEMRQAPVTRTLQPSGQGSVQQGNGFISRPNR